MMDDFLTSIHPVNSEQRLKDANAAAGADSHALFAPTDLVVKRGEIIGAMEIASVPAVLWWAHTQKSNMRDALLMHAYYEGSIRRLGANHVIVPCPTGSPFYELLSNPRSGYVEVADVRHFIKKIA